MSGQLCFIAAAVILASADLRPAQIADTDTFVVPAGFADKFGPSVGGLLFPGERAQQIYGVALFASAPTDVFEIRGIAFRFDETVGSGFDLQVPHIAIDMGVCASSSADMYGNLPVPFRVYLADSLAFPARANRLPTDFDIVFPFMTPFRYDRRNGDLILQVGLRGADSYDVDADLGAYTKSSFLYLSPLGNTEVLRTVMVTRFSGQFVPVIKGLSVANAMVKIAFATSHTNGVTLEGAARVDGPYVAEASVQFSAITTNVIEAAVALPSRSRFWRVRCDN